MLARSVRRDTGSRNRKVQERTPPAVTRNSSPVQRRSAHSDRPFAGEGVDLQNASVSALRTLNSHRPNASWGRSGGANFRDGLELTDTGRDKKAYKVLYSEPQDRFSQFH